MGRRKAPEIFSSAKDFADAEATRSVQRGRKPKGEASMSGAERQAARMKRLRHKADHGVALLKKLGEAPVDPLTNMGLADIWDRRRVAIREWLQGRALPLAAMYEAVVTLVHMPESSANLHLVAHGMREIGNRLPEYLGEISLEQVRYPKLVKPIYDLWNETALPLGRDAFSMTVTITNSPIEDFVKVPVELANKIAEMLSEHSEGEKRDNIKSSVLFNSIKQNAGVVTGSSPYVIDIWNNIRKWAQKYAHVGPGGSECSYSEMRDRAAEFERILYALIGPFTDVLAEVDKILEAGPLQENVDYAVAYLSRGGARKYFFERLNDPNWLTALNKRRYFNALSERGYWPESSFLKRMASQEPRQVVPILTRLLETPDTISEFDLIDIVVSLPPSHVAGLTKKLANFIRENCPPFTFWHDLPKLVVDLANGGEVESAFKFFDAMYDPGRKKTTPGLVKFSSTDLWHLQEGLKPILPALLAKDAKQVIQALCSKLTSALELQQLVKPGLDHSFILIDRIAMAEENEISSEIVYDVGVLFMRAIHTAAKSAIQFGSIKAAEVFQILDSKKPIIFKAIAFTLLSSIKPHEKDRAISVMIAPEKYDDTHLEDFFGRLIKSRFAELEAVQRDAVLNWIERGPSFKEFQLRWEKWRGTKPLAEDWEGYKKHWIGERLNWIPLELLQVSQSDFLSLAKNHIDIEKRQSLNFGGLDVKSLEDVLAMPLGKIVEFLGLNPPKVERGAGLNLSSLILQVAQARIIEFSVAARSFIGMDPSWLRYVISGLANGVKQNAKVDWQGILDLCVWVVEQPGEEESVKHIVNKQQNWRECRSAVADLLRDGLQKVNFQIPPKLRNEVWMLLNTLSKDLDPTEEYERQQSFDPASLSINSVRGKALHAIILYALWQHRELVRNENLVDFEMMPEVGALLDYQLTHDQSPAVRSVCAQYFPALVYIDAKWSERASSNIFPADDHDLRFWRASWYAYAMFGRPYDQVFEILKETYELAVERMPWSYESEGNSDKWKDVEEHVACHLVAFYLRGKIELEDSSLLVRFFARCSHRARLQGLRIVANTLTSQESGLPSNIQGRSIALWEWRMKETEKSVPSIKQDEMAVFGGWFASGKFDHEWSTQTLMKVLRLTEDIDYPGRVIHQISAFSQTDLQRSIECLAAFITADKEGWRHRMAADEIETIITAGLASDRHEIHNLTRRIVERLIERGNLHYRGLIDGLRNGVA